MIVALLATNLVTVAAVILWSEEQLADRERWAANREKTRDLFAFVSDLSGFAEWLDLALNKTVPPSVRGDAVANATGPAVALEGHAHDLAADYRDGNASLRSVWSKIVSLGLSRRFFPGIARSFYSAGAPSPNQTAALENLTRISRGTQGLLYAAAPAFDPSAPLFAFGADPISRISPASFGALVALASQAACLYEHLYLGEPLGPCAVASAP